jgi:hypothetical protein
VPESKANGLRRIEHVVILMLAINQATRQQRPLAREPHGG